jgi:hypothetical protein
MLATTLAHISNLAWTAIAAWVGVALAVGAGVVGGWQLITARRMRKEQVQPYVVVFTEASPAGPTNIDLVIKNFGSTAATDVRVKFSDDLASAAYLTYAPDSSPIKMPAMIPVLVPGQEWRTFWDTTQARIESSDLPTEYTVDVAFKDSRGKGDFSYRFELDWSALFVRGFASVYTQHDAARALRDISKLLSDWRESGKGGLRVFMRDGDARDRLEEDEWARQQAAHDSQQSGSAETVAPVGFKALLRRNLRQIHVRSRR